MYMRMQSAIRHDFLRASGLELADGHLPPPRVSIGVAHAFLMTMAMTRYEHGDCSTPC